MSDAVLLAAAFLCCIVGFAWLALAMTAHWQQVVGVTLCSRGTQTRLRTLGAMALVGSLGLCLLADHPSMAVLVWFMMVAAAALTTAFTLAWRPCVLAAAVPWIRTGLVNPG